jgi:hypothetical protein
MNMSNDPPKHYTPNHEPFSPENLDGLIRQVGYEQAIILTDSSQITDKVIQIICRTLDHSYGRLFEEINMIRGSIYRFDFSKLYHTLKTKPVDKVLENLNIDMIDNKVVRIICQTILRCQQELSSELLAMMCDKSAY